VLERTLIAVAIFVSGFTLAALIVATGSHAAAQAANPEADWFRTRYGPSQNTQFGEEWIIRDFFGDTRGGVFVDVGASDYREYSNTYYLDTEMGWSGLAIDPLVRFEADYLKYRPRTRFRPFFVSDVSNEQARLYFLDNNTTVTSSDKSFTERYGTDVNELTSPTVTLDDLLEKEGISAIDFLSMDIELAEPKALAGFDIERFKPRLVCIEAHEEVRQQILDYFARHHYVAVGRYLRADVKNLYFVPLAQ
jgi:FkbM family methyltransferase